MFRRSALAPLLAIALLLGAASAALASGSIDATIRTQDRAIAPGPQLRSIIAHPTHTAAGARRAIPVLTAEQRRFVHAAAVVAAVRTSGRGKRQGQLYWVGGIRTLARAYGELVTGYRLILAGRRAQSRATFVEATRTIHRATVDLITADQYLGLPILS